MRVLKSIGVIGLVCVFAGCGASDAELGAESPVEGQADATSVEGGDEDATEGGTEQVDAVTKPEADAPELAPDDVTPEDAPTPEEDVSVEPDVAPEADASPESDVAPEADAEAEASDEDADEADEELLERLRLGVRRGRLLRLLDRLRRFLSRPRKIGEVKAFDRCLYHQVLIIELTGFRMFAAQLKVSVGDLSFAPMDTS